MGFSLARGLHCKGAGAACESPNTVRKSLICRARRDSVTLQHRIVITTDPTEEQSHLVFALMGRGIWMVLSFGSRTLVRRLASLRAALNLVRPVLVECEALTIYEPGQ